MGLSAISLDIEAQPKHVVTGDAVVAADHPLASKVGAEILSNGGNAVDAVVTTLLTLGVVNPFASGIGGGGFCLLNNGAADTDVIDFRERAPGKATADMFIENGKANIDKTIYGGLAVGVPGEIAGLYEVHKKYGKLPWKDVVMPAQKIAAKGFKVGELLPKRLKSKSKRLREHPALASIYLKNGKWLRKGERLKRPKLARTLKAVAEKGPSAFYEGDVADAIVKTVNAAGGRFDSKDLSQYAVTWRKPLTSTYRGYRIDTMPPPSSGGIALIETLNILERYDLKTLGRSPATTHRIAEALKHAFADRARWLGDADFVTVPIETLSDKKYAAKKVVSPFGVFESDAYGMNAPPPDDDGTTHVSVTDGTAAVACTSTINTSFGSLVYVKDHGILLNNEMGDFTAQPGVPNNYGLMGTKQNAVAPGKRPLSSMSPTIVMKCDKTCTPMMAVGGSGGPTIITGTLLAILRVIDFNVSAEAAVSLPRLHHQWLPNKIFIETVPESWKAVLEKQGHEVIVRPAFNAIQLVLRNGPSWIGVSDPRKNGRPAASKRK